MVSCNLLGFSPQVFQAYSVFGGSLILTWLLPSLCLSFYFNSLPGGGGVKSWKLSSVLAKKSPPFALQGCPADAGNNLVKARFSLPVIWGAVLKEGGSPGSSRGKCCLVGSPHAGSLFAGICLLSALQNPWPSTMHRECPRQCPCMAWWRTAGPSKSGDWI